MSPWFQHPPDAGGDPVIRVVFVTSDASESKQPTPLHPMISIGGRLLGELTTGIKGGSITGKSGEVTVIHDGDNAILFMGVGELSKLGKQADLLRQAAGNVCAYLRTHPKLPRQAVFCMPGVEQVQDEIRLAVEGFLLRNQTVKLSDEGRAAESEVASPLFLVDTELRFNPEDGHRRGWLLGSTGQWVRELGNLRADVGNPTQLAMRVTRMLNGIPGVEFPLGHILERSFYAGADHPNLLGQARRWGAFLSVNQGSPDPTGTGAPAGVLARYNCRVPGARTVALLGKGVAYDTGGWAVKTPVEHMVPMHGDCWAAKVMAGVFSYLVEIGVPLNLIYMGNFTYNYPGTLPGSIITTRGGRKVEVFNPDAEGRLVLEDGIDFLTEECWPDELWDMATLTGGAGVALGPMINLFTSSETDPLMADVYQAVHQSGILAWPMPVARHMADLTAHGEADLSNVDRTGSKQNGQGLAALHLVGAFERAVRNYGADRATSPVLNHWDIAPVDDVPTKGSGGYLLPGVSPVSLLACAWALEALVQPGQRLAPSMA